MIAAPSGLTVWAAVLVVVGVAGLCVTFALMRRSVRRLDALKKELR